MNTWAPLWSGIVDSSLWDEDDRVIKVFMTMLATKDSDHICRLTAYNLHKKTGKTETEVLEILKILASPDTKRKEAQEFDGRRIRAVEDGWLILNGEKYREMVRKEMEKNRWRRAQRKAREKAREKAMSGKPLPGEMTNEKLVNEGHMDVDGQPIKEKIEGQ